MKSEKKLMLEIAGGARSRSLFRLAGVGALALGVLSACQQSPAAPPAPPPVQVGVVTMAPESVTLTGELPGRTSPHRIAEVRARVDGIVLERAFTEGSEVKKGQLLYRIDPLPYEAALASAQANLARAEASLESTRLLAGRYEKLLAENGVSQQEYDNALAASKASVAEVAAGKAAVQSARINLGYTRITSPIAGRIGRSAITEGAFVRQGEGTLMATVQQLDPIFVDVTQPTAEVLRLQNELARGNLVASGEGASVRLLLEDGSLFAEEGTLQFSDVTVDPSTASITLRALFPNPTRQLLPGMFVRAQLEEGTRPEALLVPQQAVRRDAQGKASVLVVSPQDTTVELRPVTAPRTVGNRWLVTEGLVAGDQVIVDGLQKVRPGSVVSVSSSKPPHARR